MKDIIYCVLTYSVLFLMGMVAFGAQDSLQIDTATTLVSFDDTLKSPDALDKKVAYNATDSMVFDFTTNEIYLFGKSKVNYETMELAAEKIIIRTDSNVVTAMGTRDSTGKLQGTPEFKEDEKAFSAREMQYNFKTKKGLITEVVTKEGDGYIHGEKIKRMPDEQLFIKKAKYTTCEDPHPHFYISANKLKVIPNNKIVTGPANMVVEGVPTPLAVPFGFFPNKKGAKSGIIMPGPSNGVRGFGLVNGGYYWAASEKIALQGTGDFYTNGSWKGILNTKYKVRYKYNGYLNLTYSNMRNGLDFYQDYSEARDFNINWQHSQEANARPNSTFSARVNAGTSSNFANDPNANISDIVNTTFNSNISYQKSWAGKPFNWTISVGHNQNLLTGDVDFNIPSSTFSMNRIYPLKRKKRVGTQRWYEKVGLTYNATLDNRVNTKDSLMRLDEFSWLTDNMQNYLEHKIPINTSFKALKHLNINPGVSYTERWWLQSIRKTWNTSDSTLSVDTIPEFTRNFEVSYTTGFSSRIYGMYQIKSKRIKGIRHMISPSVNLNYTPKSQFGVLSYQDTSNIVKYSITEQNIRAIGYRENAVGIIGFGINNTLEMKVLSRKDSLNPEKKIKILEGFSLNSSYNVFADSLNWSAISLNARTTLFDNLNVNINATGDPYDIDSLGRRINTSFYQNRGTFIRVTNVGLQLSFSLRSKKAEDRELESDATTKEHVDYIKSHPEQYLDFTIPWTMSVNYQINYSSNGLMGNKNLTHTVNLNGDVNLTKKWKVAVSQLGYDIEDLELIHPQLSIVRDLHCWELAFNWNARYGNYTATLRPKSGVLQDLKLTRRKNTSLNTAF